MKYEAPCLAFTLIGPYILECTSCNGYSALVPFPNGFLVAFSCKQNSQVGNSNFMFDPKDHNEQVYSFYLAQYALI